jgi:hypothetical protein
MTLLRSCPERLSFQMTGTPGPSCYWTPVRLCIIVALVAFLAACGGESGSSSPTTTPTSTPTPPTTAPPPTPSATSTPSLGVDRYKFALTDGSTIKAPDGNEEVLTGYILTSRLDLGPNHRFAVRIEDLRLQSAHYLVSSTDGRLDVRAIGTLGMSVFGTVNDSAVQLFGSGGPQTYVINDRWRAVASELRGVVIADGKFTVTIYARR